MGPVVLPQVPPNSNEIENDEKLYVYWLNRVTNPQVLLFLSIKFHQKNPNFSIKNWMSIFEIQDSQIESSTFWIITETMIYTII